MVMEIAEDGLHSGLFEVTQHTCMVLLRVGKHCMTCLSMILYMLEFILYMCVYVYGLQ